MNTFLIWLLFLSDPADTGPADSLARGWLRIRALLHRKGTK